MGEIDFDKLLLIAVVVLLLFGTKRVSEIGASLGKGIREFKRSLSDTQGATSDNPVDRPAQSSQPDWKAQDAAPPL
jgi:sec-independent protein translocase protein TatA